MTESDADMNSDADLKKTDSKFLHFLDELCKILNEDDGPPCSTCGKFILKLSQHYQKTHGHDHEAPQIQHITESIPPFVSSRNLRTRKQRVNYSEHEHNEQQHENVQKPIRHRTRKSKVKLGIPILPSSASSIIDDVSNPEIKIEDLEMEMDQERETDFQGFPDFGVSDEEETKIDINYITGLDSVITTTVPDNTVFIPSSINPVQSEGGTDTCPICKKKYRLLIEHLRRGHKPEDLSTIGMTETTIMTHECNLCPKIFCSPKYLSYHFKSCHEEKTSKNYPCRICDEIFDASKELNLHFKQCHPEEKPYNCTICEKKFDAECQLKFHSRLHTGEKPFPCDLCTKTFSTKALLKRHKAVHAKALICEVCGKNFSKQADLDVHRRAKHTGERPFVCKVCGKGFPGNNRLYLHMIKHSNEKKIVCEVCGNCFKTKTSLVSHMVMHTGEKTFVCDHCGKGFYRKQDLQDHLRVHTEEKPFVCELCGKGYKKKSDLMIHERTHTGERPYVCTICNKGFTSANMLNQHRKRHGDARPYLCPICDKGFKTYDKLHRHKKIHTRKNSLV